MPTKKADSDYSDEDKKSDRMSSIQEDDAED